MIANAPPAHDQNTGLAPASTFGINPINETIVPPIKASPIISRIFDNVT